MSSQRGRAQFRRRRRDGPEHAETLRPTWRLKGLSRTEHVLHGPAGAVPARTTRTCVIHVRQISATSGTWISNRFLRLALIKLALCCMQDGMCLIVGRE